MVVFCINQYPISELIGYWGAVRTCYRVKIDYCPKYWVGTFENFPKVKLHSLGRMTLIEFLSGWTDMYSHWRTDDPEFSWGKVVGSGYPAEWWYYVSRMLLRPFAINAPIISALRHEDHFQPGDEVLVGYSARLNYEDACFVEGAVSDKGVVPTARNGSGVYIRLKEQVARPENLRFIHGESMVDELLEVIDSPLLIKRSEFQYLLDHPEFLNFFLFRAYPSQREIFGIAIQRYREEIPA